MWLDPDGDGPLYQQLYVLGYAALDESSIDEGVRRIAAALESLQRGAGRATF